jgi:hypothetical protein
MSVPLSVKLIYPSSKHVTLRRINLITFGNTRMRQESAPSLKKYYVRKQMYVEYNTAVPWMEKTT